MTMFGLASGVGIRASVASAMGLTLAILAFTPGSGHAQVGTAPSDVVRSRNDAVKQVLDAAGDPISDETREELKGIINGLLDFQELSRRSLRRHWNERTPQEQSDFVDVFRGLIRSSSVQKLEIYETDSITYEPAEMDGDESRVVTFAHKNGKSVEIVYVMHRVEGEWKAFDVVVDGSSTLRTYQDSFQREINAKGYTEMYTRMADKLAEEGNSAG